ncbi:unnamed protein product [Phytophthora fragariaefolia]|uniref:Unnamed protein product n=1 Tax=Phytophthora fragariaefolia TaxID=1490495 RepID=A0A9W6XKJ7_9STRA|nr:unnamed protein product [Phytophthora fragariaefolia]
MANCNHMLAATRCLPSPPYSTVLRGRGWAFTPPPTTPAPCACASPTTSSPALLETPPRSPARTKTTKTRHPRQGLQERRQAAAPYARQRSTPYNVHRPAAADQDRHVRVTDAAHGRYQAAATDQDRPVRRGAAAADPVHQACHRVVEPAPRAALPASQPGDRPEKPAYPVCAAIDAESMGGLMWFLNHSCKPAAEFKEVSNRRRTSVDVATTQKIKRDDEVTVDYGDDLWFVCRCMQDGCRHRSIQDEQDP